MYIRFRGQRAEIDVPEHWTVAELRGAVEERLGVSPALQKLIVAGKIVSGATPGDEPASNYVNSPTANGMLLSVEAKTLDDMNRAEGAWSHEQERRATVLKKLALRPRVPQRTVRPLVYTFAEVKALPYGDVDNAQRMLERVRDDKAVQALMEKHQLKVGLLTELDPFTNTGATHRRLGRNDNMGQVISLRIRTDGYEGFCNYNEIKKVLCHELAHNLYAKHDAKFWAVCRQYERELKDLDPWRGRGRRIDGL